MQSSRGYGQVSGDQSRHQCKRKRRLAVIGVSAVVLVAMVVGVVVAVSHSHHNNGSSASDSEGGEMSTSMKAIKSICQPTDYKEACESTLSAATGSNVTDPKELVKLTFNIAIDQIHNVFNHSALLAEAAKDPRTSHALENCQELLDYAIDDLKNSFEQLGSLDLAKIHKVIEDLKVWLSAAITYQETCLDGFENTTGDAGASMRKAMKSSSELTQNTLAIVNEISSVLTSFKIPFFTRRLLSDESEDDEFPPWVTTGRRRLLTAAPGEVKPNVVVATDGSGDYKTINDALAAVPKKINETFVMYIKEGVYKEIVQVNRSVTNLMMVGDGPTKTRITGNLNFIDGTPTFKTATMGRSQIVSTCALVGPVDVESANPTGGAGSDWPVIKLGLCSDLACVAHIQAVIGDGFIAKNIGFENTAGPQKHQAVALRVQSDMAVFYNCRMDAYQDTLYAHTKRQFYRECTISGTIDFIFGNAASIFQNCLILVRKPLDNQQNIVTAHGRKDRREPTAIIIQNCTISASPEYYPVRNKLRTYLGRPWKEFSRTFIMQSQLDDLIDPQGWLPWMGDFGLNTCFYSEFDNRGAGAGMTRRVTWRGVKKINWEHAQTFTVENFIQGNQWLKATGVPYIPGLLPVTFERPPIKNDPSIIS